MKNLSIFQIVIYVLCVIGIIFAVLLFSGKIPSWKKGSSQSEVAGAVIIWGTLPEDAVTAMKDTLRTTYKNVEVSYFQKSPASFQAEFVDALASGTGPDLVIITPADLIQDSNKLFPVPYASLPDATFRGAFVDQASLFLGNEGVLAFPLLIDPMVMYYNRDMLTSSFVVTPPSTWDDVVNLNKTLTQKDEAGRLTTETVALGTFDNITHAKDLISMIIFQAGNKIVDLDPASKKYVSVFGESNPDGSSSVASAVGFYTSFANPGDADRYSWNPSLPKDKSQFIAGNLALYFGYASELSGIRQRNPNLNFDVALMPQRSKSSVKITYGTMHGIAVTKSSKNISVALLVAQALAGKEAVTAYMNMDKTFVPARRDMLADAPKDDARQALFYNSAIISRGWLDPDANATSALFKRSIDQINAGTIVPGGIISPMNSLLQSTLQRLQKSPDVQ